MNIKLPLSIKDVEKIKAGDKVYLTGYMYTARDSAHKRMVEDIKNNKKLPFKLENETIYYMGPCPAKPGEIIGSAGPTTSFRMDKYTPKLLEMGLIGMIGKGSRGEEVRQSIEKNKAIYFGATGGTGALLASKIKSVEVIAYEDLGTEAIRKIYVENFPVTVIIDSNGKDIYSK